MHLNKQNHINQLSKEGVISLDHPCSKDVIKRILDKFHLHHKKVKNELSTKIIGIGSKAGYKEIVQRSPGRWDLPICIEKLGIVHHDAIWWPIVSKILGSDAENSFSGIVFSEPNSPSQYWHIDSPHITNNHEPAHALNVLVALQRITPEMGPTQYALKSHYLTNHLKNKNLNKDSLIYQSPNTNPTYLVEHTNLMPPEVYTKNMEMGFCQIFDDRLLHRGLANKSYKERYVAYFSYRRKGYNENTHFESKQSIFKS